MYSISFSLSAFLLRGKVTYPLPLYLFILNKFERMDDNISSPIQKRENYKVNYKKRESKQNETEKASNKF